MGDFTVRSGHYKAIKVVPGAARVAGAYELFSEVAGFYLTAFTAAQFAAGERAALVIEAEQVEVDKTVAETWVAGEAIYWDIVTGKATNVEGVNARRRVGFARQAAANGATVGTIAFMGWDTEGFVQGGRVIRYGQSTVTGSLLNIVTGLGVIEHAVVSVKDTNQGVGDGGYVTYDHGADGLLDLYAWDDAGVAASVATVVSWIVIGTP